MRGAPQSGLARLISPMSWRSSESTGWRPGFCQRLFHFQNSRKPSLCHRVTVSGWTNEKVCLPFSPILSHTYEFLLIFRFDFAYSRVPWRADPDELSRGKIALVLA